MEQPLQNATAEGQATEQAVEHYRMARQAEADGDLEAAIEHYRLAISLLPPNSNRMVSFLGAYAGVLCIVGRYELSLTNIRAALTLDPSYAMGYARLGIIQYVKGDFAEAVLSFQQALVLRPGQEKWEKMLGEASSKAEKFNKKSTMALQTANQEEMDVVNTVEAENPENIDTQKEKTEPEKTEADNGPLDLAIPPHIGSDSSEAPTAISISPLRDLPPRPTSGERSFTKKGQTPPRPTGEGRDTGKSLLSSGRKGEKNAADKAFKKERGTLFRTQSDRGKRFGKFFGSPTSKSDDDEDNVRRTLSGSDLLYDRTDATYQDKAARILGASAIEVKLSKAAQILGVEDSRILVSHQGHSQRRDSVPEAAERLEKIAQLLGFDEPDNEEKEKRRFVFSLGTPEFTRVGSRRGSKELPRNT